jgi:hemerythrin-like domain-containing protein
VFRGVDILEMNDKKHGVDRMRQIDENLRRVYDETAGEAIPDRFQRLLEQLKEQDAPK